MIGSFDIAFFGLQILNCSHLEGGDFCYMKTDMHSLMVGICCEKCTVRRFHCCANTMSLHKPVTHLGYVVLIRWGQLSDIQSIVDQNVVKWLMTVKIMKSLLV